MTKNDQFLTKIKKFLKIEYDRDNLELFEFRTSKSLFSVIIPRDYPLSMSWLYISVLARDSNPVSSIYRAPQPTHFQRYFKTCDIYYLRDSLKCNDFLEQKPR